MNKIFVVDGNWYLHRCWFTLRTSRPIEEVLPHNLVGLIMKDACAVRATHVMVAFDGPTVFRYKIFKDYKANRRETSTAGEEVDGASDIYSYLPNVRAFLETSGVNWIQLPKYEADDILASASAQYSGLKDTKVIMGSKDKDGYQSLKANSVAYDSTLEVPVYITMERAIKKFGVAIDQMIMYQTLIGDPTDNIPTLLGAAAAKAKIKKWGSFKNWFKEGTAEDKLWLRKNQVKLELNKKLVTMVTNLPLPAVEELKVAKLSRLDMPRAWYAYQDLVYPKSKGLFRR